MRRCTSCNEEIAEGVLFCPHCGVRAEASPPAPSDTAQVERARRAIAEMERVGAELSPARIAELAAIAQSTPEMREQLTALTAGLEAQTARATALEQEVLALRRLPTAGPGVDDPERTHGFSSPEEFYTVALRNHNDPRLRAVEMPGQQRDLTMAVGAGGGFLIPPQFADMLLAITPQEAVVRPRATVIPAGAMPDAPLTMPLMNQAGANGVYAGMTGAWVGEGGLKPETQPIIAQLTLGSNECAAFVDITDKLLRNNPGAVTTMIQTGFRDVILGLEDRAFISGSGVAQPLGFLGHACNVNVARTGAGAIVYADVTAMHWRMMRLGSGSPVWLAHPSTLPQLMGMASPLGQLIWQPSAREGMPSSLLGYPVIVNERQPILGTAGDLMFCNLRYYLVKDGVGLSIRDDGGLSAFDHNVTRVKAFRGVDGQPWLATPLLLEDGVTTVSPFVILN